MSLAILFHFWCAQHVSDINISIIRSLRLFCWINTLVVLFLVRCMLEFLGSMCIGDSVSNTHRTKNNTTNLVIQQNSSKLLMMYILMSETCWAYKKWNKIASDIKLVFYSSTTTMMHGPINIRYVIRLWEEWQSSNICKQPQKIEVAFIKKLTAETELWECLLPFGSEFSVLQSAVQKYKDQNIVVSVADPMRKVS